MQISRLSSGIQLCTQATVLRGCQRLASQWSLVEVEPGAPFGSAARELQFPVPRKPRRLPAGDGPSSGQAGRLSQLRRCVCSLLKEERIELPYKLALETREYAERLIQEAILTEFRVGGNASLLESLEPAPSSELTQNHLQLLELAKFWLISDKKLLEKLFKVFVPRYRGYNESYTAVHKLTYADNTKVEKVYLDQKLFGVLELKGNPWPPIGMPGLTQSKIPYEQQKSQFLINVLLDSVQRRLRSSKQK